MTTADYLFIGCGFIAGVLAYRFWDSFMRPIEHQAAQQYIEELEESLEHCQSELRKSTLMAYAFLKQVNSNIDSLDSITEGLRDTTAEHARSIREICEPEVEA